MSVRLLAALALLAFSLATFAFGQDFRSEAAVKFSELEKENANAFAGVEGWLFLTSELHFLAQGNFWGEAAAKAARSSKAPDPLPAIVDFNRQLHDRGIELLLVPIPPKAAIYPEKTGFAKTADTTSAPAEFYQALRAQGVNVLDLAPIFTKNKNDPRGPLYCRTDSHFSGVGCVLAAQAIAETLKLSAPEKRTEVVVDWREISVTGDLIPMLPRDVVRPPPEKLTVRAVTDKRTGAELIADPTSPLLLMGDSHTLVFHEFLGQRGGLLDQLTNEIGFVPDLIGTRGSGATAVRVSLFRRAKKDPEFLRKKKTVVWCFAAREFTEADQGWPLEPIAK